MYFKKSIVILFTFLINCYPVIGQTGQLRFKHYTTVDGLSQGDVYHMNQDSRGFMWFGTLDGLDRFDGYNFKVYRPQYNDTTAIAGERINSIIEDKTGMLWIGTNESLNRYNYKTDGFDHFYIHDKINKQLKGNYDPIFIDDRNELYFVYNSNLASINLTTEKFTTYPFANGVMQAFVSVGYPAKEFYRHLSKIYTVYLDGLHIIDLDKKHVEYYFSANTKNKYGTPTVIYQALEDKNHLLWLGTVNGLISFNPTSSESHLYNTFESDKVTATFFLVQDDDEYIWCGGGGQGLFLFDPNSKRFIRNFRNKLTDPESIADNSMTSLFIDKDKNIWAGIDPIGIDKINPSYEQLKHAKINPENKNVNYTSSIWSISEIDTNSLLLLANHKDVILHNKRTDSASLLDLPAPLKNSSDINFTLLDSHKTVWIASDSGLFHSDNAFQNFILICKENFSNTYLFEFKNKILVGKSNGLYSYDINSSKPLPDTLHYFSNTGINYIGKANNDRLCVSTTKKDFFKIDISDGKVAVIQKMFFDFIIKSVYFETGDIFWMATNIGLVRYNLSKKTLKTYTEKDGLSNNYVYCLLKGNDGNLWMSTNHGISRFNMQKERFSNYGLAEGTQALEFNTHSFFQSSTGTIYFGGVKGLNYFNPSTIKDFSFSPPLEILNIYVNGSPVSYNILQKQSTVFSSDQNNITIDFAALDYNRNDNINYLYKLDNQKAWISNGNRKSINFANLAPGTYHLELAAQYSYNYISPQVAKLSFTILPPFYLTTWFTICIIILATLIIYAIYKYRISQLLKLQAVRNSIARDLHDDIGSTLSSINIYTEVASSKLKKQKNDEVEDVLKKIGISSREMIVQMSDIVWSIGLQGDDFEKVIHRMQTFADAVLPSQNIHVEYNISESAKNIHFTSEECKNIFLIYKEAIHNLIKYSEARHVFISLNKSNNKFILSIQDDGKGFDLNNNDSYNGNGLKNMMTRAESMNALISINSEINVGTSVEVVIPA